MTSHDAPRPEGSSQSRAAGCQSGIVAGGRSNLISGVEAEARRRVEAKYADEWNSSGLFRRWKLQRMIDAEVAALAAEQMPEVAPEALF